MDIAARKPTRNLYKRYCGTQTPDQFLVSAAKAFVEQMFDPMNNLSGPARCQIKSRGSKVAAGTAKDGAGERWIKLFSAYEGDQCIVYPFATAAKPRGCVTFNFRQMEAHRAMCLKVNKLPPEPAMMALHRCGNGHLGCVTPKHLYWGTASDNAKDAHRHRVEGKFECEPVYAKPNI